MTKNAIDTSWQNALRPVGPKFEGYPGDLAEPKFLDLKRWPEKLGPSGKVVQLHARDKLDYAAVFEVFAKRRMEQLFHFCGVELGDWQKLAWELIYRHVPGLTTTFERKKRPRKAGRTKTNTAASDEQLIVLVHEKRCELAQKRQLPVDKISLVHAMKELLPAKDRSSKNALKAADVRYHQAKKRTKDRAAIAIHKLLQPKEIERLQKFIAEYL